MKIYKLVKDGQIVYIGRTKLSLSRRKGAKFYKLTTDFVRQCSIELIEETDDKGRERFWIEYYQKLGYDILNKKGGDFSSPEDSYRHRLNKIKNKTNFTPMSKEEKLQKRREYYRKNKEYFNKKRRSSYANGDSWYHRKKQSTKILV